MTKSIQLSGSPQSCVRSHTTQPEASTVSGRTSPNPMHLVAVRNTKTAGRPNPVPHLEAWKSDFLSSLSTTRSSPPPSRSASTRFVRSVLSHHYRSPLGLHELVVPAKVREPGEPNSPSLILSLRSPFLRDLFQKLKWIRFSTRQPSRRKRP